MNIVVAALPPLAVLPIPSVDCRADIVFVVDEAGSISSSVFSVVMSFLSQVVSRLDIDTGNTRVALVTYSRYTRVAFNLNAHSSIKSVLSAISSVSHNSASSLETAAAFDYVRTRMLTSAAGDRHSVRNIVVFVTDAGEVLSYQLIKAMVSIEFIVLFIAQYLLSVGRVIRYFVKTIVV